MKEVIEMRNVSDYIIIDESRSQESRTIEGYAFKFNTESIDLGGFKEIIRPGALTNDMLLHNDVHCVLDHDIKRGLLARSRNGVGSLKLEVDEIGLRYSFEAPHTQLGEEVLENLRRGDISQSSFKFQLEDANWVRNAEGEYIREITKFKSIKDVSLVYTPAYEEADVAIRSLQEFKESSETKENLVEYFNKLKEIL